MTMFRFGLITGLFAIVLLIMRSFMDSEYTDAPFGGSTEYSNKDKAFLFEVPNDGQMMRFEIYGNVPFNSWQSIEFEIYDNQDNYLFTFYDEIWAENGRDGGEYWEERNINPKYAFRIPYAGTYKLYASAQGKNKALYKYQFRVVAIQGDSDTLKVFNWICIFLSIGTFAYLAETSRSSTTFSASDNKPSNKTFIIVFLLFLAPTVWLFYKGYSNSMYFHSWRSFAYDHKTMTVDRQIEGRSFRGGSGKGGK